MVSLIELSVVRTMQYGVCRFAKVKTCFVLRTLPEQREKIRLEVILIEIFVRTLSARERPA